MEQNETVEADDNVPLMIAKLKEDKEFYEECAKICNKNLEELYPQFYDLCLDKGMSNIKIDGKYFKDGKSRSVSPELKMAPTVVDQQQLFGWLRANEKGDLIKETVHPATLKSLLETMREHNLEMPPETIVTVFDVKSAKVVRGRS